ncbi:hypothetical protein QTP88_015459 [Uroleucon formosanum]
MTSLNILTNESIVFHFPTIFEYSYAQTHSNRLSRCGPSFSKNKVFINNGDTFNGKYIIEYFKKTTNINEIIDNSVNIPNTTLLNKVKNNFYNTELHKINETQDLPLLTEIINIMSGIGLLTKKQYRAFLDQPSNIMKINYLRNKCIQLGMYYKPHLMPLQQPTKFKKIIQDDKNLKIITSLLNEQNKCHGHLKNCEVIKKNKILTKLMQCGVTIFDVTNDSEVELEQARFSFNYIYNELINYSDEEIIRSKEKGICRKFILISTAMTWVKETHKNHTFSENEEVNTSFTEKCVLERLPIAKYQIVFEFEKLLLKCNSSKIKNIFQTYIIGTGIIYGHEENALRYVFTSAWLNPKEMYIAMLNRTVPVFHIDELAKLVFIVSKNCRVKNNYILAVEQESYGFNNIIKSMCDELCSSHLVIKEDSLITNQYKFNSFTWDLICSDLNIDSMLDIIVPDYQIHQTSIISNMKKLTHDFVEANNLYSLKIIVSGQPTHVSSNIAKRLAKYYKVQLIDIPNLINNYFISLKNDRIELELKINDLYIKRANIKHALSKLTSQFDEWLEQINEQLNVDNYSSNEQNNEMMDDIKQNFEIMNNNTHMSENEILTDSSENSLNLNYLRYGSYFKEHDNYKLFTKNKIEMLEKDTEINNIKLMIENLNAKYKEYENNFNRNKGQLDNYYLLPLIKELLSSFSCRNQGYVLDIFPLYVEQIEFIFNNDISYPNTIILLSYNQIITDIQKCSEDTLSTNEKSKICLNYQNLEQNMTVISNSFESKSSDIYHEQEVSITGINMHEKTVTASIYFNNKQKYELTSINYLEHYSTKKGIIVHRLNVPLELADETISYNLQCKFYTDTIISLIGRNPFKDIRYETITNENQKSNTTRELQKISNKLNMMNEQWKQDINKTLKQEKKKEYRNSVKIHNFISTNVLPKLLKEVPSVNSRDSHFPEKTLNKTKLCNTQTDENITHNILITKST